MTEVRQWLDANAGHLSDLAGDLGVPADMVHMAAVLVLGGLTDPQIGAQLRSVRWDDPVENAAVATVLRALPAIRAAATEGLWTRTDGGAGAGHRIVAHTADAMVEAWGPDRTSCLIEALSGLVELFADVPDPPSTSVVPLGCQAAAAEDQLVSLLEEVIYVLDVLSVVPVRFHLAAAGDGGVAGDMEVVPLGSAVMVGPAPKAVSYHGLSMEPGQGAWRCRYLVDV